jgi:transglutaminase-like putative cysteine protease
MNIKKLFALFLFLLSGTVIPGFVDAAGFNIDVEANYELNDLQEVKVTEIRKVSNKTQDQIISKTNQEVFTITDVSKDPENLKKTVATLSLTIDNKKGNYTVNYDEDSAKVTVQYPSEVRQNQTMTFRLTYTSYGMIKKSGAVYDFFAPGLADSSDGSKDTAFVYNAVLKLKKTLPKINFVAPGAAKSSDSGDYTIYNFNKENLVANNIWVQFGTTQYYKFSYQLSAKATDTRNLGLINTYKIVVPRDVEGAKVYQHVFFKTISPEPSQVEVDNEGNLFILFSEGSNKDLNINIEGYVELGERGLSIDAGNSGDVTLYNTSEISGQLQPAEYWEVNNDKVKTLALELKAQETNTYKIILGTYEYLVSKIDYNTVKKFGLNPRQGALQTLEKGSGVCMEYSDLFITLSRAQGIPARAAFGYGHDPLEPASIKEPHQWAEVLMPGHENWVSADITWGLSGKTLIGGDLNHIYTHVSGKGPENIANISRVSYGQNQILDLPIIVIEPVEMPETNVNYQSQKEIAEMYKEPRNKNFFEMAIYKISLVANNFENVDLISKAIILFGLLFVFIPLVLLVFKPLQDMFRHKRNESKVLQTTV